MFTASGSYAGDNADPRAIIGLGFQPDVVIIKRTGATDNAVIRLSSQVGDLTHSMSNNIDAANLVQSLDADGFTVGNDARVNTSSAPNTYYWFALKCEAADSAVFTYTGDGTDNRVVGSFSFTPAFVVLFAGDSAATNRLVWKSDQHVSNQAQEHNDVSSTSWITSLNSGNITVRSNMNNNAVKYHCLVVKATAGQMTTVEYTGNGSDDRDIAHGLGATPVFAWLQAQTVTAQGIVARFKPHVGDLSSHLPATSAADAANWIQAMDATNVQVGTDARVNTATSTPLYTLVAFAERAAPAVGGHTLLPLLGVG